MLRPEYDPTDTHSPRFIRLDGIRYRITDWHHLQALANPLEGPVDGWATGRIGDRRYAAPWTGGAL